MAESGFRLGIDFGTSNTVAVLRWPDGRSKALLFDGAPILPSAVYTAENGSILTGRDAIHSARLHPHRFEPYPKRRIDEETVYLGDREIRSTELIATVLRRVAVEAQRVANAALTHVTLTHPAAWGAQRRDALGRAAAAAGLPQPLLVAEPVAAASYFVGTVGAHLPIGGSAVVYDFGAGTFDATVVRRTAAGGFDVLATEGLTDAGGLDVDAAIVTYLGTQLAERAPDEWRRLSQPADDTERRAAWQLWEDARQAKETLSRAATTYVHVPLVDDSVPLGREQLEQLARPILDRTVTATLLSVAAAGLTPAQLSAVFLVGGSSRIPLAATLLHRGFGTAPMAIEQPELVVAEGALQLAPRSGRAVVGPSAAGGPVTPGMNPSGPAMAGPGPVSPGMGGPRQASPGMGGPRQASPGMGGPQAPPGMGGPGPGGPAQQGPGTPGAGMPGAGMPGQGVGGPVPAPGVGGPVQGGQPTAERPVSAAPMSGPPVSGMPMSGPPVSGPGGSPGSGPTGAPVSGPTGAQVSGPPVFGGPPQPAGPFPPQAGTPQQPATFTMPSAGPSGPPGPGGGFGTPQQAPSGSWPPPQPGQPVSGQPAYPGQPAPGQPTYPAPGQPTHPGQPAPGQPTYPGQPVSGQAGFPGQPASGQPGFPGQPMSGQPMSGQPMSGQPMSGQPMSGPPMSGPPMSGAPVGGAHGVPLGSFNRGGGPRRSRGPLVAGIAAGVILLLLVGGGIAFALTRDDPDPPPQPPVAAACGYKIAYLGILSGDNSGDGKTIRNSARLAVDKYNSSHQGCTAELVEYDTKGDDDEAGRLAGEIVRDEKVVGVVGPIWFSEAEKVMPIFDAAGLPVVSPSLMYTIMSQKGWKTFHRTVGTDADQAAAAARHLTQSLRAQRVFIVSDNDEYATAVANEARLRLNTAFIGRADVAGTETTFASVVTQVVSSGADAVYFSGYHEAGGIFVKELRAAKPDIKIMGWDRIFTDLFVEGATDAAAEGVAITCPCAPPSEARDNFANDYREKTSESAGYYGPESFDAANVFLAALNAGKSTRADVNAFVSAYDGPGVSRQIKFTPTGDLDAGSAVVWAYTVRGGSIYKDKVVA